MYACAHFESLTFSVIMELKVANRTPEKDSAASHVTCGAASGAGLSLAKGNTAPPRPRLELHSRGRRSAEQPCCCSAPLPGWLSQTYNAVVLLIGH